VWIILLQLTIQSTENTKLFSLITSLWFNTLTIGMASLFHLLCKPKNMAHNQGEIENLSQQEAIEKMRELVKHNNTCLFITQVTDTPPHARPMATQQVDEEGNFWFLSGDDSDKNSEVMEDSQVQLFYSNPAAAEFMTVSGNASISRDKNKIKELWNSIAKAWFKGGKDDPRLTLIKVTPEEAYYWDTKSNKMVALIKILAAMVSGKTMDDGIQGKMTI
jgi:general stress protein 26